MVSDIFQIKEDGYVLNYHIYNGGPEYLLAFHGFGLSARSMQSLTKPLSSAYTIISVDLFFHGKSHWPIDRILAKSEWKGIIREILDRHNIKKFSLAGFSMGGKFALATLENYPKRIDALFLFAPDGIATSMWYDLATYPFFFQGYFKSMIVKPRRFYRLVSLLKNLKLMDKGVLKFATKQMNTVKKRRRVYYSWVVFKKLKFNLKKISGIIKHNNIKITMVLGKHDKIITGDGMHQLLKYIPGHYKLLVVSSGHNYVIDTFAEEWPDILSEK